MEAPRAYDLVVYGATPGGVACAVRAAREGLSVLLVTHAPYLGGMLTSGLCVWDTQWEGKRAPIYDELRQRIFDYYKESYGADSEQYKASLPGPSGHSNGNFEPKVAKELIEELVAREPAIAVVRRYYPVRVERSDPILKSVTFKAMDAEDEFTAVGHVYADCSYEGDLMAVAGASYRYGRESREEFGEPHAGRIFVRNTRSAPNEELERLGAAHRALNLRDYPGYQEIVEAPGSGTEDERVQAYNWRTVLTNVPENRLPIERPANYDPERLRGLEMPPAPAEALPNGKIRVNRPQLIGRQGAYVDGTWADRQRVMDEHWDALLACLYFLRTDPSVPEERRERMKDWGLAADEFVDNGHRPYEIYARETRRLVGRYIFTEHDATLNVDTGRAPIHADAIAVTEWYIDIHACTDEKLPGTLHEGKIMLHQETFPGQIPFRAILPRELDNLLVPGCVSSSHVGWSTIRLEPTWMNIGESAGWAAMLAVQCGVAPAALDVERLLRTLARGRVMMTFFNDVDVSGTEDWIPAVEYFGVKGFFAGYDARADQPLLLEVAQLWADAFLRLRERTGADSALDPQGVARLVREAEQATGDHGITEADFRALIAGTGGDGVGHRPSQGAAAQDAITRGDACRIMFELLETGD